MVRDSTRRFRITYTKRDADERVVEFGRKYQWNPSQKSPATPGSGNRQADAGRRHQPRPEKTESCVRPGAGNRLEQEPFIYLVNRQRALGGLAPGAQRASGGAAAAGLLEYRRDLHQQRGRAQSLARNQARMDGEPLLKVQLSVDYPARRKSCESCVSRWRAERLLAWSDRVAAARARWRWRSCACCT